MRHEAVWDVRERRYIVRWATGCEGVGGTNFGEGNIVGIGAMGAAGYILGYGSTLGSGNTLGSGTNLGGGSGGWTWTGKMGTGRGKYGTGSGVGGDRVVNGIQLEKISWSLEMANSCLWWK